MMDILRAQNITKSYQHQGSTISVLAGIDLNIKKNEFLGFTGPSGTGKSTLLHILAAIDKPDTGKIFLNETQISGMNDREICSIRNKKIGFVFQFYNLLDELTVLENILLPYEIGQRKILTTENKILKLSAVKENACQILDKIGLSDRINFKPFQLSGGQQQKVAIARAIINHPEILFCDEPTGNLDSKSSESVISLLKQLNNVEGITLVIATHNTEVIKSANRIFRIKDGLLSA